MAYLDSRTIMSDAYTSQCTDDGIATDVAWIKDGTYNSTEPLGYAPCVHYQSSTVCDGFWAIIYQAGHYVVTGDCNGGGDMYERNMKVSMRHELGHTVGLHHYPPTNGLCEAPFGTDAMVSDWIPRGYTNEFYDYNSTHKGEVDDHY